MRPRDRTSSNGGVDDPSTNREKERPARKGLKTFLATYVGCRWGEIGPHPGPVFFKNYIANFAAGPNFVPGPYIDRPRFSRPSASIPKRVCLAVRRRNRFRRIRARPGTPAAWPVALSPATGPKGGRNPHLTLARCDHRQTLRRFRGCGFRPGPWALAPGPLLAAYPLSRAACPAAPPAPRAGPAHPGTSPPKGTARFLGFPHPLPGRRFPRGWLAGAPVEVGRNLPPGRRGGPMNRQTRGTVW